MPDIMVDLETLGTEAGCVITSIGACSFDIENSSHRMKRFIRHINVGDAMKAGFMPNADTMLWWLGQDDDARTDFINGQKAALGIRAVLVQFAAFLHDVHPDIKERRMWSNGADFDLPILSYAYQHLEMDLPWKYYNSRCYRTMKGMYPQIKKPIFKGTKHSALDDAEFQTQHLKEIVGYIRDGVTA